MKAIVVGTSLCFLCLYWNEQVVMAGDKKKEGVGWERVNTDNTVTADGSHDTLSAHGATTAFQWDRVPDVSVTLVTGERLPLPEVVDQKKYIFINIWSEEKDGNLSDARVLDSLAEVYKSKLLVIGLLDGNLKQLNRLIKRHQMKGLQGLVPADMKKYLQGNAYPCGILFSKTGRLVHAGMHVKELGLYLEKHVLTSRAKF